MNSSLPFVVSKHWTGWSLRLVVFLCIGWLTWAKADPGDIDPTFIAGGLPAGIPVLQPDGKIFVRDFLGKSISRYNSDGTVDSSFNGTGSVLTKDLNFSVSRIVGQTDGKILVGALKNQHAHLVRWNADGTLDLTFNGTGELDFPQYTYPITGITQQTDGKILIVLEAATGPKSSILRLNSDGSVDPSFNGTGQVDLLVPFHYCKIAITPAGNLMVTGTDDDGASSIYFFNPDGSADPNYPPLHFFGNLNAFAFEKNGNLLCAFGGALPQGVLYIERFIKSPDAPGFTSEVLTATVGTGPTTAHEVAVQADGKILIRGTTYHNTPNLEVSCLIRMNPDGSLDQSFKNGLLTNNLQIQDDGKIIGVYVNYTYYPQRVVRFESEYSTPIDPPNTQLVFHGARKGLGNPVPGIPGQSFVKFGIPSINNSGTVAFSSMLYSATGMRTAVLKGDPASTLSLVTKVGDPAPGMDSGVVFSLPGDPALDQLGNVAFKAKVAGPGINLTNADGLFTDSGGTLVRIIGSGALAPGIPGAILQQIKTFILSEGTVYFCGKLVQGPGSVSSLNDTALWSWDPINGNKLILRNGDLIAGKTIKAFSTLRAFGQQRSFHHGSRLFISVVTTDRTYLLVDDTLNILRRTGDTLASGDHVTEIQVPSVKNAAGNYSCIFRTDRPSAFSNETRYGRYNGIYRDDGTALAVAGDIAPGFPPATSLRYSVNFLGPFSSSTSDAWIAKFVRYRNSPDDVGLRDTGIWDTQFGLVAQKGDFAPSGGAKFIQFLSAALPEGLGPIFTGNLEPKLMGINATNNTGLWATNRNGKIFLLSRKGQSIDANGSPRIVKGISALKTVVSSPNQPRAFNDHGDLIYRVEFADGTQALMRTHLDTASSP